MTKARRKDLAQQKGREAAKRERVEKKLRRIPQSPELSRPMGEEEQNKAILIVSEGINTEISYFNHFKIPGVSVRCVGKGMGTMRLVKEVPAVLKEEKRKFDEIWVVFDKDDFVDFEEAIRYARFKGYGVAYTNQAVEYWFILHFKDHQGQAMDRKDYAVELNRLMDGVQKGVFYDSASKTVTDDMFDLFESINPASGLPRRQEAYDRASRIFAEKSAGGAPYEESVTTLHCLVGSICHMQTTKEKRRRQEKEEAGKKAP